MFVTLKNGTACLTFNAIALAPHADGPVVDRAERKRDVIGRERRSQRSARSCEAAADSFADAAEVPSAPQAPVRARLVTRRPLTSKQSSKPLRAGYRVFGR
jgi:hypothetical protein